VSPGRPAGPPRPGVVALAAAWALAAWACAGSGPPAARSPALEGARPALHRFTGGGLTFLYPAEWHAEGFDVRSTFVTVITYLSNQPLRDPCTRTEVTLVCGLPLDRLGPGGVLASWSAVALRARDRAALRGEPISVGGQPASLLVERPGSCREVGGDLSLTAAVPRGAGDWLEFGACLRGPGTARSEAQVRAVLASTAFTGPGAGP
jgi:hypothetical protein